MTQKIANPQQKTFREWLRHALEEVNYKLDHIIMRLREEDPRIYQNGKERWNLRRAYNLYKKKRK